MSDQLPSREIVWCEFHQAGGPVGLDCWGAGVDGQDSCDLKPMLLVDRDTMIEGVVTATGNNTMLGHGEQGPWAFVTVYGDFEPFDTMLVLPFDESLGGEQ